MKTVTMLDAVGTSAAHIPATTPKVAGYVTGVGVVPWPASAWKLFPDSGQVTIDQTPDLATFAQGKADVADLEEYAGTVAAFVAAVKARMKLGITWSTCYGTDATLAEVQGALNAAGPHGWYYGRVDCWLADWDLSQAQASALVGTEVHGLGCRAVQWASPSSNPSTLVPGSTLTLAVANVDISEADPAWHPAPGVTPPPPPQTVDAFLVLAGTAGGFTGRAVTSSDGGRTWS